MEKEINWLCGEFFSVRCNRWMPKEMLLCEYYEDGVYPCGNVPIFCVEEQSGPYLRNGHYMCKTHAAFFSLLGEYKLVLLDKLINVQ